MNKVRQKRRKFENTEQNDIKKVESHLLIRNRSEKKHEQKQETSENVKQNETNGI